MFDIACLFLTLLEMRRLTRNDYASYYSLIREFRDTEFSESGFHQYIDSLPANIEIWVIEEDGVLIATATIIFEPKLIFNICTYAHIEDVCVTKQMRGKGIGSVLIKCIIDRCKIKDCKKITICCSDSVSEFYIKNTFEKRGIQCCILLKNE